MVSPQSVQKQLKKLKFNPTGWGRSEAKELPNILVPDEEIYELANGIYEGGFALLVATNIRVILIDRKPLNYLTVEDLRFDMINEIDYSHRLVGARILITTGSKTLRFTSYNQQRLRKLINHVQNCMAEVKMKQSQHQEGQVAHLERLNQQLQAYLVAQSQQQIELSRQLQKVQSGQISEPIKPPEPLRPSPELSDFLYAQGLLNQYREQQAATGREVPPIPGALADQQPPRPAAAQPEAAPEPAQVLPVPTGQGDHHNPQLAELYAEGMREVFGSHRGSGQRQQNQNEQQAATHPGAPASSSLNPLEVNPMRIAYSKLPMALRNRKFGRPSFHAHSQSTLPAQPHTAEAR